MKIALSLPDSKGTPVQIDSGLPEGVPTGGLFDLDKAGNIIAGTGIKVIWVAIELFLIGAVFLAIFQIVRGGVNLMTSGGEKERFVKGRERIRYGIIGLLAVFMSFFLINLISNFFGVNLLSFTK